MIILLYTVQKPIPDRLPVGDKSSHTAVYNIKEGFSYQLPKIYNRRSDILSQVYGNRSFQKG